MDVSIENIVIDSVKSLYDAELIDTKTMQEFEVLNSKPVSKLTPDQEIE